MTAETYLQFRRPENQCLLCGVEIAGPGHHRSVLELASRDEAVRRDFCDECWTKMERRDYFGYWVTKRIAGIDPARRRLAKAQRNEALWRLFSALHAVRTPELEAQLFLLAHLLMKYKVLEFRRAAEPGRLAFYHGPSGESFEIADVPLDQVAFKDAKDAIDGSLAQYAPPEAESAPIE